MKKNPNGPIHLPAIRCRMGDRGYIVAAMTFQEISDRIGNVAELYDNRKLSQWIQRQLDEDHAERIAKYLVKDESRFFNALVMGVYGGHPDFAELRVEDKQHRLTDVEEERINRSVGVLMLSGKELLFPIDGQHRVAGIKESVKSDPRLGMEEMTVLFVGHARTELGKQRTRQLFVMLNQRAKKVSDRDIVALDEDNGLAVVTRRLIEDHPLFRKEGIISFSANVAIRATDPEALTSILGLHQIVKALYPRQSNALPSFAAIQRTRPDDGVIDIVYNLVTEYWKHLVEKIPEYRSVLVKRTKSTSDFRSHDKNHLLFRPAGQLGFARAVQTLTSRGRTLSEAISLLLKHNTLWIHEAPWRFILWDPIGQKMINSPSPAETFLLRNAGQDSRSESARKRLDSILKDREQETSE
jgi:DNA sulfur modification protein DndB